MIEQNWKMPAFPLNADAFATGATGLTKLEYFAAMAMQGILTSRDTNPNLHEAIATLSIRLADELLKQLDQ